MSEKLRNTRRATLRVLYAIDLGDLSVEDAIDLGDLSVEDAIDDVGETIAESDEAPIEEWDLVVERARAITADRDKIDDEIRTLSPNWRIERMAAVDRNLLRLGIFEILEGHTAPLIVINACVELAKEFGTASTPGFVNGLLDQLCQNHEIPITASPQPRSE